MAGMVHSARNVAVLILLDEVAGIVDGHTIFYFMQAEVIEAGTRGLSPAEMLEHLAAFRREVLDEITALRKAHRIPLLPAPSTADGVPA
ncbi:hypothetical protein [Parvibaculum sp.]|uniref:hypothetical protein n=1 Tax=Parvibaculum sp. TaxID=2024848 RepID=UPI001B2BCFC5|nr:hypothetical protein [Parvibaculum sp.]MBO6634427.1 hypothetical protein [Parvibaculum sp.]MBO6679164.1 hypothetical protein [Parvibaculum sp.]MBO6685649.1 hypothetical protein [Parvibaculum sp.]MBO6905796.1 hypothetical protein [Parvibaculum sp.]